MKISTYFLLLSLSSLISLTFLGARSQEQNAQSDKKGQSVDLVPLQDTLRKGIRAVLVPFKKGYNDYNVFTFDEKSMAMYVEMGKGEYVLQEKNSNEIWLPDSPEKPYQFKEQSMYFDNDGYIYTWNKNKGWYKTPFVFMKKMMQLPFGAANAIFPNLKLPDGKVTYYGMDVSPDKYPILEWAFVYKVHYFESAQELNKEVVECRGTPGCLKYTLMSGKDKDSYVLFDHYGRLAEIHSINSGTIHYVYGNYTVKLPEAKLVGSF